MPASIYIYIYMFFFKFIFSVSIVFSAAASKATQTISVYSLFGMPSRGQGIFFHQRYRRTNSFNSFRKMFKRIIKLYKAALSLHTGEKHMLIFFGKHYEVFVSQKANRSIYGFQICVGRFVCFVLFDGVSDRGWSETFSTTRVNKQYKKKQD